MNNRLLLLILTAGATLTTLFVRVPLPTGGYFNFGDVAVIFGGLLLADRMSGRPWLSGFIVGGVGSAVADLMSGYALFAPITLLAKGLEGGIAAIAGSFKGLVQYVLLIVAGMTMVTGYFIFETFLPSYGLQGALREIIPNVVQAVGGVVGGLVLYRVLKLVLASPNDEQT